MAFSKATGVAATFTPTVQYPPAWTPTFTYAWDFGDSAKAMGGMSLTASPTVGQTFTIGPQTFTWVNSGTAPGNVVWSASVATCVANIITSVTRDLAGIVTVTQPYAGVNILFFEAVTAGTAGNSLTFTESCSGMLIDGTGTLGRVRLGVDGTSTQSTPNHTYALGGDVTASLAVTHVPTGITHNAPTQAGAISGLVVQDPVSQYRVLAKTGGGSPYVPSPGDNVGLAFNATNVTTFGAGQANNSGYGQPDLNLFLQIDMLVPTRVNSYTLTYPHISYNGYFKWELFGSNDGSTWNSIQQVDLGYLTVNPYVSAVAFSATYRYYRFAWIRCNNGNSVVMNSIQLHTT